MNEWKRQTVMITDARIGARPVEAYVWNGYAAHHGKLTHIRSGFAIANFWANGTAMDLALLIEEVAPGFANLLPSQMRDVIRYSGELRALLERVNRGPLEMADYTADELEYAPVCEVKR